MSKQGKANKEQSNQQVGKQTSDFNAEMASEFVQGNTKSQSQKKSGTQMNKKSQGK
ncbi:hypothetical protein J2S09_005076 [Bacillus fengqiuensis]|nr:hypothetical protein [Bacillus fengqiuensis]